MTYLSEAEGQFVHEQTAFILEEVGVGYNTPAAIDLLEEAGAVVDRARLRAKLPWELETVNWMAVGEAYRRRGLASRLYAVLEREARARGMKRLWVTARTPAFFAAQGFRAVPPGAEWDTLLGECPQCGQYGRGCTPQALFKDLDDIRPEDGATRQEETWHDQDCGT